jgi:predicted LPLAT superfamily acyltransferase
MPQNNKRRGNHAGFMFFVVALRLFGVSHARRMAAIVCIYYLLFDWGAVRRALPYICHISPDSGFWGRLWLTYHLFISQAWMLLDREAYLDGIGRFEHVYHGYDTFEKLIEQQQSGTILLGGHIGNWQLAVEALKDINKTINIVVHKEANEANRKQIDICRNCTSR